MRTLLRLVLLALVFVLATGCIYARGKRGTNTGSGSDPKQGGPWTQGDPPSQAFAPDQR